MGRILTTLIYFWLSLSPLFGQRLLVRQPIEGFRGNGEVIAYSSSRIFLQLNKDGEWPRQIKWEIRAKDKPICAITFNKVGWQYTSSKDSCGLDWMQLDLERYSHRLYVVENVNSPLEKLPNRLAESLLLVRPTDVTPTLSDATPKSNSEAPQKVQVDTLLSRITTEKEGITSRPESSNNLEAKSKNEVPLSPVIPRIPHDLSSFSERTEFTPSHSSILGNVDTTYQSQGKEEPSIQESETSRISPATDSVEETPDYIFTVPDYQPRKRWRKGKKIPTSTSIPEIRLFTDSSAPFIPDTSDSKEAIRAPKVELPSDESKENGVTLEVKNDTVVYLQTAPFISVASFQTLEYAQQVLQQFTCPKGCIIVRSEKGLYYRIGFYPDPKNIAVDLREIRKKYSDAWLVN